MNLGCYYWGIAVAGKSRMRCYASDLIAVVFTGVSYLLRTKPNWMVQVILFYTAKESNERPCGEKGQREERDRREKNK